MLIKRALLLIGLLAMAACDANTPINTKVAQPATVQKSAGITVMLDIQVGTEGQVINAQLSNDQADTLFAKAALMQINQQRFDVRYEDNQPVEYWLRNTPIKAGQVSTLAAGDN